jgi:tRNA pseudouridine38-40 synthase
MARYFIELSYKGTNYHGWQIQKNATGVQQLLNKALSLKLGNDTETVGSGRTDKGVHAIQQFAHFDTNKKLNQEQMAFQLNRVLPNDIVVKNIYEVDSDAHARFDAIARSYQYKINQIKDPFLINTSYYRRGDLDLELMNQAAGLLMGTQDFESFSKVKTDVNHFICTISKSEWIQMGDQINYSVTADRFLRGMVRTVVGTMLDIGTGKISLEELKKIITSLDRKKAGRAVPAHGLFLTEVKYSPDIFINHRP